MRAWRVAAYISVTVTPMLEERALQRMLSAHHVDAVRCLCRGHCANLLCGSRRSRDQQARQ